MTPRTPDVLKGVGVWQAVAWIGLPGVCLMILLSAVIWQNQTMMQGILQSNASNSEAIVRQVEITQEIKAVVKHHDDVERNQETILQRLLECAERKEKRPASGQ